MNENRTTLTLTNNYGECSVPVNSVEMGAHALFDELVVPVLLAAGYARNAIFEAANET